MNTPITGAIEEAFDARNSHRLPRHQRSREEIILPNTETLPVAMHIERVLSDMPTSKFH